MSGEKLRFDKRRLRAMIVKEFSQIRRDPSTFLIALAMPLLLLFLFGYAVSLDISGTRVALVVEDDSGPAAGLTQSYAASPYFNVEIMRDRQTARERMVSSRTRGIIVIPQDFGRVVASGRVPEIQIITDGSQPNMAAFIAAHAQGVFQTWLSAEGMADAPPTPQIEVSSRYWFNPGLRSRYFLVPGAIATVMTMIGTLLTALVVAREWERGTMEAIMATPVSMAEFIASKILPYFLLALASMTLCAVIGVTLFGLPFRGSILALYLLSSAFLLPALGLGLFISSATKNQFVASQMALLTSFLPTFLLSGFIYEISSMPLPIQALTYIVPARYLIPSLQTIFLTGDIWAQFLPNMAVLVLFGLAFFLLSFRVTRRSLD
ncbi:ABC-2 type transport system permease protein [Altererythrobacter atlanticus]|uniref:Inner membrane transport permease YbhS n=1 Tax=Croceibacterium atlanticum TaxID=1267766 RepID=A0A0F7KZD3_9SPHN|nr:ABC transporter permease [Croceibacterium atlanticum]AKH44195.1 Inner membrane transport permease YbhS [Croceibacterium atlanticum]MBB5732506.1 ABC-2 type transport system permease protein [Croceibacterium atlanticum]